MREFGLATPVSGAFVANALFAHPLGLYYSSVLEGSTVEDLLGGVIKPLIFGLIIGSISCHRGLSTEGGTVGVGRSVTNAVVQSSIVVIIADYFLAKALQVILGSSL